MATGNVTQHQNEVVYAESLNVGGIALSATDVQPLKISSLTVAGGSSLTLTAATHHGKIILLDTAAGTTVTLPAATGSGARFRFVVSVLATSNSHKIQVVGNDTMQGIILGSRVDSGNAVLGFAAGATSDTITLNRTTTGSVSLGEWVEVVDIAADLWQVSGVLTATGAAFATPFSAAV